MGWCWECGHSEVMAVAAPPDIRWQREFFTQRAVRPWHFYAQSRATSLQVPKAMDGHWAA